MSEARKKIQKVSHSIDGEISFVQTKMTCEIPHDWNQVIFFYYIHMYHRTSNYNLPVPTKAAKCT